MHVVDDDASFRASIARLLRASGFHVIVYESATQFLEQAPVDACGCILLDVQMPGLSGLELQDGMADRGCLIPIIFLTGHGDIPMCVRATKAGAEDFLSKPVPKELLLGSVRRAFLRSETAHEHYDRLGALRRLVDTLTPRQKAVFALVVRGKLNKQIAFELRTSVRTVKAHRHEVMFKLKVRSVVELVSLSERLSAPDAVRA
ncbi:response regulator [Mesorhizobium sp. B2-4-14]|uniref:response regulator transcription factor n=1 Tax=Mesorhizobium sp. B2-4-14 TaxID=2589935 RepID=UPI001FEDEAD6|nr:response regulator [Mesorhizobium sp. B2-4-14]